MTEKLNTQLQCYQAGKRAFRKGAAITDNPCQRVTHGHSEWRRGWFEVCRDKTPEACAAALQTERDTYQAQDAAHHAAFMANWNKGA
jgi:hypothetical protein